MNRCFDLTLTENLLASSLMTSSRVSGSASWQPPQGLRAVEKNHPLSTANLSAVDSYISSELQVGRMVGPLLPEAAQCIDCSPVGVVLKGHSPGRWWMIVDLLAPVGHEVNDGISREACSLSIASLDDAVGLLAQMGPGSQLLNIGLKDAYHIIPVHPQDHHLFGFSWRGGTYVDRSLPFGLRSAAKLSTVVADAMAWILYTKGGCYFLHYLDSFLFFFGRPGTDELQGVAAVVMSTFTDLKVPVAAHKTEGSTSCVTFPGILIDTMAGQLRLADDELTQLVQVVELWQTKRACTKREPESLMGHLSYAASVVHPERVFLHSLFTLFSTQINDWSRKHIDFH